MQHHTEESVLPNWAIRFDPKDFLDRTFVICIAVPSDKGVVYGVPGDKRTKRVDLLLLDAIEKAMMDGDGEVVELKEFGVSVLRFAWKIRDRNGDYGLTRVSIHYMPRIPVDSDWIQSENTFRNDEECKDDQIVFYVHSRDGPRILHKHLQHKINDLMNKARHDETMLGNSVITSQTGIPKGEFVFNISQGTLTHINAGKKALFRVEAALTPLLISCPYQQPAKGPCELFDFPSCCSTEIDSSLSKALSSGIVTVTIAGSNETVEFEKGKNLRDCVIHRCTAKCKDLKSKEVLEELKLDKSDDGTSYQFLMDELLMKKNDDGSYTLDGNRVTVEDECVFSGDKKIDVMEGLCLWVYDNNTASTFTEARKTRTKFQVVPFDRETSIKLEEAKVRGDDTLEYTVQGQEYIAHLAPMRMSQHRKDNPNQMRRIWRFGSEFIEDKIGQRSMTSQWSKLRKLRGNDLPDHWRIKDNPSHDTSPDSSHPSFHTRLDPVKDKNEFSFVINTIRRSILAHDLYDDIPYNFGGDWLARSKEKQKDHVDGVVHFRDSDGTVHRVDSKAIHIVAIYRIENPNQWRSYRVKFNEILSKRGGGLRNQPATRYLVENPLVTGPILDDRANVVLGFNGTNSDFAVKLIEGRTEQSVRAADTDNTFGPGLYYTDDFIKAMSYCACPQCGKKARSAKSGGDPCECEDRNLRFPYVAFMTRAILGNILLSRDRPTCSLHGSLISNRFKLSFDLSNDTKSKRQIVVWLDESEKEPNKARDFVAKSVLKAERDEVKDYFCPEQISFERFMELFQDKSSPQLNIFYINKLNRPAEGCSGFITFKEKVEKTGKDVLSGLTFAILFGEDASESEKTFAGSLQTVLKNHGADGCFYKTTGAPAFAKCGIIAENDLEATKQFFSKYMTTDPTQGVFEIQDSMVHYYHSKCDPRFEEVDSTLVEDVMHCSPGLAKRRPVSEPSPFDVRQNKHREFVVFDGTGVYSDYAILFYQYESKEAMLNNIPNEYPTMHYGVKGEELEDVLFFVKQAETKKTSSPDSSRPINQQMESGPAAGTPAVIPPVAVAAADTATQSAPLTTSFQCPYCDQFFMKEDEMNDHKSVCCCFSFRN